LISISYFLLWYERNCFWIDNQEENLNKPEFEGLWNKKFKNYDSEDLNKDNLKYPAAFRSKAEKVNKIFTFIRYYRHGVN
jgi:hypothetical protein